jgi:hypothetical protein
VTVCLPLFGDPGRELEDGGAVRGKQLRDLGEQLRERLDRAADTLDRLLQAGWTARAATFDLILHHPEVQTHEEAVRRLQALAVDPEEMMIVEDVDEDEAE